MYKNCFTDWIKQGVNFIRDLSALKVHLIIGMWIYALIKLLLGYKLLLHYSINPWIFAFLDLATVPSYVLCWLKLLSLFTGKTETFYSVLRLSIMTFFASTAPYLYLAWAGRETFPKEGWALMLMIVIFPMVNQIKKIIAIKNNA